jgi:RimJ/RimL family protein N-acetyltransferase
VRRLLSAACDEETRMLALLPVTLEGKLVRLEPLGPHHAEGLYVATRGNEELWRHMAISPEDVEEYSVFIQSALAEQAAGTSVPFAIIERAGDEVIGSTRFMDIRAVHSGVEIGWTFLASRVWRTGINTECKYLLLRHAFEVGGAARVQLKTDALNDRSRAAILRLGAQFEGILRKHQLRRDGTLRDTAMYSIIDDEWPAVKTRLEGMLAE